MRVDAEPRAKAADELRRQADFRYQYQRLSALTQ